MCADVWNQDQETWWICSSEDSNFQFIIEISVITWIPTDSSKRQIYVFCTEPGIWSLIMNRHHSSVRNKQFTSPDEVWSFYNHLLNGCLLHWKIARYLLKKKIKYLLVHSERILNFYWTYNNPLVHQLLHRGSKHWIYRYRNTLRSTPVFKICIPSQSVFSFSMLL